MTVQIINDWTAAYWPTLRSDTRVAIDTETTGLAQTDHAVSMSIARVDNQPLWFAWGHDSGNNCSKEQIASWVKQEINNNPNLIKIFHNAQFDIRALYAAGISMGISNIQDTGIIAPLLDERLDSFSLDSLSKHYLGEAKHDDAELNNLCARLFGGRVALKNQVRNYYRAPGNMVAEYCIKDSELTLKLYDKLRPLIDEPDEMGWTLSRVYALETALIPILIMMNRVGFKVDVNAASTLYDDIGLMLQDREDKWNKLTDHVNPNSSKQMALYFASKGIPVQITSAGNPSVTTAFLASLDDPAARLATDIRKFVKFRNTFVRNYILKNVSNSGFIHGQFHQLRKENVYGGGTGTVSGRFSSSGGLNLQNLPSPDPDNPTSLKHQLAERVRGVFIPSYEDGQILAVDFSQVEFRIIAHYAGGKLRESYNNTPEIDFHSMVAALTGIDRKPAKNINFGLAYGMGENLMAERLGVDIQTARKMLNTYHTRLPDVRLLYNAAMRKASRRGYIKTFVRKRRFYPDPERRFGNYKSTHKALNALAQGCGADIMKQSMINVMDIVDWKNVALHATVHDELVFTIPQGSQGIQIANQIKEAMEAAKFDMTVPLMAEAKVGKNWGVVRKLDKHSESDNSKNKKPVSEIVISDNVDEWDIL